MSDAARRVRVHIRHVQIAELAEMTDAGDEGVFVTLDDPPPVRSILAVHEGDESVRALEVTGVVEVPEQGGARGIRGRFVESDALRRFDRVGTEHLSDGEAESTGDDQLEAASDDEEGAGTQMAMPAPVMDPDESRPIDLAERRFVEEDPDANDANDANEAEASPVESDDEGDESDDEGDESDDEGDESDDEDDGSGGESDGSDDEGDASGGGSTGSAGDAPESPRRGKRRRGRKRR